jgi:hypothetical protein
MKTRRIALAWTLVIAFALTFRATRLLQHISGSTLSRTVSELKMRDFVAAAGRASEQKGSQPDEAVASKSVAVYKNGDTVPHAVLSVEPQLQALERAVSSLFPEKLFGSLRLLDETGLALLSVAPKVYVLRERELWVWPPPLLSAHYSQAFNRSISFADGRSVADL